MIQCYLIFWSLEKKRKVETQKLQGQKSEE